VPNADNASDASALRNCRLVGMVAAIDLVWARSFYEGTLGLRLAGWDPFGCSFDANGAILRIALVSELSPAPYTVAGWLVPDMFDAIRRLTERGVQFERFPGLEQDALAIWTAPGGDMVAWFKDPDANVLSLTQLVKP